MKSEQLTFDEITDIIAAVPAIIIITLFVAVICLTIDEEKIRSQQ
jgi:hypothetical protein